MGHGVEFIDLEASTATSISMFWGSSSKGIVLKKDNALIALRLSFFGSAPRWKVEKEKMNFRDELDFISSRPVSIDTDVWTDSQTKSMSLLLSSSFYRRMIRNVNASTSVAPPPSFRKMGKSLGFEDSAKGTVILHICFFLGGMKLRDLLSRSTCDAKWTHRVGGRI